MGVRIAEDMRTALWSSRYVLKRPKSICFCVTTCAKSSLEAQTSPSSILYMYLGLCTNMAATNCQWHHCKRSLLSSSLWHLQPHYEVCMPKLICKLAVCTQLLYINALCGYNFVFITGKWYECRCTGERPPPCEKFTFNQIDKRRAILFGGKQSKYKVAFSEVYILIADEGNMVSITNHHL